jgi:RNA recognition motif-containing protein
MSAGSYAAAMAADRARLASAQKRNLEQASLHGAEDDAVQGAWDSVLRGGQQQAAESEEEARRKKAQKKSEKRNAKRAETAANAGSLSLYVSGIPKELSFNAVQNLFSKAGKVTRCKLYKDEAGENKGDGIVTFATEEGVQAALERDDWNLFGDILSVSRPTFTSRETAPKEDWRRIVTLKHMFSQEELGAAADYRAYVTDLEEEVWRECARLGTVEQVPLTLTLMPNANPNPNPNPSRARRT